MPSEETTKIANTVTKSCSKIWADDVLERWKNADFLQKFLLACFEQRRETGDLGSYVLQIDAEWGAGKTFFMERFGRQLHHSGHLVATVNAWRDDHADEPFVSIMAAIDTALDPYTKKKASVISEAWRTAKSAGGQLALRAATGLGNQFTKKLLGMTFEKLFKGEEEELANTAEKVIEEEIDRVFDRGFDEAIKAFRQADDSIDSFKKRLSEAISVLGDKTDISLPVFILVDELDRCRPSYAVKLLERVKHLFDIENVVFVFATNSDQLQHSIAGAYGAGFDGLNYLKRFFDRTYKLSTPQIDKFVADSIDPQLLERFHSPADEPLRFLTAAFDAFGYGGNLRGAQQIIEIIRSVEVVFPKQFKIDLLTIIPLAVSYYQTGFTDQIRYPDGFEFILSETDDFHRPNKRVLRVERAFDTSVSVSGSRRNIEDALFSSRADRTNELGYLSSVFGQELNTLQNEDSSAQASLPELVANAGVQRD